MKGYDVSPLGKKIFALRPNALVYKEIKSKLNHFLLRNFR